MENKKISVVMPIYDMHDYLPRCMDSIINNTYQNLEIICVNDGSKDDSESILMEYAKKDSRVKVINQENKGVQIARNKGLEAATGDYVAFLDPDDWIHPMYFELLMKCIEESGTDVAVCSNLKTKTAVENSEIDIDHIQIQLLDLNECSENRDIWMYVWARLYKKELLQEHTFCPSIKIGEDTAFNIEVLCESDQTKVAYISNKLYYYYQRDDSIVHTSDFSKVIDIAEYLLPRTVLLHSKAGQRLYLLKCIKDALAFRFLTMFDADSKNTKKRAEVIFQNAFALNKRYSILNIKDFLLYYALAKIPYLYQRFRTLNDPSLLKWVKIQKALQKKQRIH